MDWLAFSLGVTIVSIAAYFYHLWTVGRRRAAYAFLGEELVALLFFTALAYFVLNPGLLIGGGAVGDFSIGLAINRTLSLRDQFYQLHVSIVQTMEGVVVVDVVVSVAAAVLTAGAAIPLLQAFNTGLQAILGVMEGAATLAGTAAMLLQHLYWLLLIGKALAFLIPVLGGMLVVPRARKVALSGLAVVFVLAILLPYAVNASYRNVAAPKLKTRLPRSFGRVKFSVRDVSGVPVATPSLVFLHGNGTRYVLRVQHGSVKLLPPGKYYAAALVNWWINFSVDACCLHPHNYSYCQHCYVWPAAFTLKPNETVTVSVTLPVNLIPSGSGVAGHTVARVNGWEGPVVEPGGSGGGHYGSLEYVLRPDEEHHYYISFRGGGYSVEFGNGTVKAPPPPGAGNKTCWCWYVRVAEAGRTPPGLPADTGAMRRAYAEYVAWWNRTRYALPPSTWGMLEPPKRFPQPPPYVAGSIIVSFYRQPCAGNATNSTAAVVRIYGAGPNTWNDSTTRLGYIGLWGRVVAAGDEVKGLVPVLQVALSMLYNIYIFVVLGGLAFGGLLGVAGYTLPGIVQGYFRQGIRRSFVTLPGLYRRLKFARAKLDERKAVVLPRKRLAFELRRIDATHGWSRRKKALEKAKVTAKHVLPAALDVAGERLAPGIVKIILDTYDWWVEYKTGWHRETTRGHYYLFRAHRVLRWTPRDLEEPLLYKIAELLRPEQPQPQPEEKILGKIFEVWRSADKELAGMYGRAAARVLRERVIGFLDEYKRLKYMSLEEALKRFGSIPAAYKRGYRVLGNVEKEEEVLEALLGNLKADTMKDVDALINEFFANIHPSISPILSEMGVTHSAVARQARLEAIEEAAAENPRAVLAKMTLRDPKALHYLSLADWVASARTEDVGLNVDREGLSRLALLAYLGVEGAAETLLGLLEGAEQGFTNKVASMALDELIAFADEHGLEVTSTLASEIVRWGLRRGFEDEEIPGWMYASYDLARIACLEAAAKGLLTPPVGLWLGLESESIHSVANRVLPPFAEEAGEALRRAEEDLKSALISLRLAEKLGEKSHGWLEEALKRAEENARAKAELLAQAYAARLAEYVEEKEKAEWIHEKIHSYIDELIPKMHSLYEIIREKLAENV